MKALNYNPDNDQFSIIEKPAPIVSGQDVLIRVLACGLNPVDSKINFWFPKSHPGNQPWVGGLDVAGEIVALGDQVHGWEVGDRVIYHGNMFRPDGGLAEFALHDHKTLIKLPQSVAADVAAATPCAGWTAWRALIDKLNIRSKSSLFINGGAGGVGSFALQIAHFFGVKQIITTASAAKHRYVKQLGATHVIDYQNEDVIAQVMEITGGKGVEAALNTASGEQDQLTAQTLGFEGEMVELVVTTNAKNYPGAFDKGLSFHQLSLGSAHRHGEKAQQDLVKAAEAFTQLLSSGEIQPPQMQVVSLEQAGDALKEMRNQRTLGKIVMAFANN